MPTAEDLLASEFAILPDIIRAQAQQQPERIALIQDDVRLDYAGLDALVDRATAALQRDGLKPGDAVAIVAATSIRYIIVVLAALRAGGVSTPLAPSSTPDSLAAMIADCGANHLFLDAATATHMGSIEQPARYRVQLDGDADAFDAWLAPAGSRPEAVEIAPEHPFNIIYSSGTTGTPKGIVQSHGMRWNHIWRGRVTGYAGDAVTMISTPLYSNTTLVSVIPALAHGGTLVLLAKFVARTFLELAERHRATHAMLVPVQCQRLLDDPEFDSFDLSSFRMKTCTSAPFAPALKAEMLRRWPGGLVEIYGMTEGGGTLTLAAHLHPDKLHTVGRPVEGHVVRLIDDDGREVPPGETGELVGRSPAMMTRYHNQPDKTREAEWFDSAGTRYIRTGDIGRFDADGFLTLVDRKKDMIISGGFNIYPSDLETVMRGHGGVADASVVGIPSPQWGETPIAFVVPRAGVALDAAELREWVAERVSKTQRLSDVVIIDELPRSAIGKVLKRELRDTYLAPTG